MSARSFGGRAKEGTRLEDEVDWSRFKSWSSSSAATGSVTAPSVDAFDG